MPDPIADTQAFYTRHAPKWAASRRNSFIHLPGLRQLCRFIHPEKIHVDMIDVGCAHGMCVPMFKEYAPLWRYLGIDACEEFLVMARECHPKHTFQHGDILDANSLPQQQKFDVLWCAAVLQHIPREYLLTAWFHLTNLMKPGAYSYIALPVRHPSPNPAKDPRHFTIMSEGEQRSFLESMGWKHRLMGNLDGSRARDVWRWHILELQSE